MLHRTTSGLFEGFNTKAVKKIPVMSIAGFFLSTILLKFNAVNK